jgi:hypothetical protein
MRLLVRIRDAIRYDRRWSTPLLFLGWALPKDFFEKAPAGRKAQAGGEFETIERHDPLGRF